MTDTKDKPASKGLVSLERIRQLRDKAQDYWHDNYQRGLDDLRFVTEDGGQWDKLELDARTKDGKPSLQFNLLHSFVKQQINAMRQNRPSIHAEPADSKASVETAKVLNGLIRDIEVQSGADIAYDTAAASAAYQGIGFIRVMADYIDDASFEQQPKIMPVYDASAVYLDPNSKELDGSDAEWAQVFSWVDRDGLIKQYGEDAAANFEHSDSNWVNATDKTVCIVEHFELVRERSTLYLLPDGSTTFDKAHASHAVQARDSIQKRCVWTKASGSKILESRDFVVPFIPVIPVYGLVIWVGEKRWLFSMIHHAKAAQKLFNHYKSGEAYVISEAMREQWIAPVQTIQGFDDGANPWASPADFQVLHYNHVEDATGQPLPAPQLKPVNPALSAIMANADKSQMLIEQQLNMQPAAMGASVNQQSGKAVQLLQQRADVSHFHLVDNLNKSLEWLGVILLAMIQALYDVQMVKRITGEDGKAKTVEINQPAPMQPDGSEHPDAVDNLLNNVQVGRYDVRISTGASYISQRQEAQDRVQQLVQAAPQLTQVAPDLLLGLLAGDLPEVGALIDRFKRSLPPQLTADNEQQNPEVQQVMAQAQQQMEQLQGQLQQAVAAASDKESERQLKIALAQLQSETTLKVAQLNAEVKLATTLQTHPIAPLPEGLMDVDFQPDADDAPGMDEQGSQDAGFLMPDEQPEQMQPELSDIPLGQPEEGFHPLDDQEF